MRLGEKFGIKKVGLIFLSVAGGSLASQQVGAGRKLSRGAYDDETGTRGEG